MKLTLAQATETVMDGVRVMRSGTVAETVKAHDEHRARVAAVLSAVRSFAGPAPVGAGTLAACLTFHRPSRALAAAASALPSLPDVSAVDAVAETLASMATLAETVELPTADEPVDETLAREFRPVLVCHGGWAHALRSLAIYALHTGHALDEHGAPVPAPVPTWAEIAPSVVQVWADARATVLAPSKPTSKPTSKPRAPRTSTSEPGGKPTTGERRLVGTVAGKPWSAGAGTLLNSAQARLVKALGLTGDDAVALRSAVADFVNNPTAGSLTGPGYEITKV